MDSFLIILCASTLGGSVLYGIARLAGGTYCDRRISWKRRYLLMKAVLLYFLLPAVISFVLFADMRAHKIEDIIYLGDQEISRLYVYGNNKIGSEYELGLRPRYLTVLFLLWAAGALVSVVFVNGYKLLHFRRLCRMLVRDTEHEAYLKEIASEYKIKRNIALYTCPYISSPFLAGFLKSGIVLSDSGMAREKLEVIFRHECTHYKSRDAIFRILVRLMCGIHWFNPLIWLFSREFYDYGELACDEKVSDKLTEEKQSLYAHLLIDLSERAQKMSYTASFSNDSEKFLKRRILIIMKKETIKKTTAASVLAFLTVILCCPIISYASAWGVVQVRNEIARATIDAHTVHLTWEKPEYTEYRGKDVTGEHTADIMLDFSARDSGTVDFTIPAEKESCTEAFTAIAGKGVKVMVTGDNSSSLFKAVLVDYSGETRCVDSYNGEVSYTFPITKTGTYYIKFENLKNSKLHIVGTVWVNY